MATISIPKVRQESTVLLHVGLTDNGVAVDWSGLEGIKAYMYSDAQRVIAGKCDVEVDGSDSEQLNVTYPATRPQYLGRYSLLVRCTYYGREKTFDVPCLDFVARTAQATGVTVITDPEMAVQIEVNEVSTSLLDSAIAAALNAAVRADAAAAVAEADHTTAESDHTRAESDHATAAADHTQAESDHTRAGEDHTLAAAMAHESIVYHDQAAADHTTAAADHTQAAADHSQAGTDHTRAESDHGTAAGDHTQAGTDHATAGEDHTRAESDHTTAGTDHTQAGTDHTTAAGDHTQAGEDHTQAVADHEVVGGYNTRLTKVEGDVSQLDRKVDLGDLILTNQTMNSSTGAITSSDTSLLTSPIYGAAKLTLPDGFRFSRLSYYNISDDSFNSTSYINNATVNIAGVSGCYARVTIVTNPSGSNIAPTDLKFSLLPEKFAEEDTRLDRKLIKIVGRGADGAAAGATQVGDIFYNSSNKLLRERYNAGGSFRTIPFIKGAVYTMYGQLWVWNGTDLVPAGEPTGNVVFDNIAKTVGIEYEIESNTGAFTPAPHIIPAGANVEVYVESFSSDAEGTVQLSGFSSRDGSSGSSYFGTMAQGATFTKVPDKIIEGFMLYPVPTTASYKIKVKYGISSIKNEVVTTKTLQQVLINSSFRKVEYDDDNLSEGWYNLALTKASNIATEPSGWACLRIEVKAGDIVSVWTVGGNNARAWALTRNDKTILTRADANADYSGAPALLNVTEDGYLYVNCKSANTEDFKVEHLQNTTATEAHFAAPCMFNPKVDLKKQNLRILDIGNSYTSDAVHYLPNIISAAGITEEGYSHYKAIRGSASFKTWLNCYNDEDTATYTIGKISGDNISGVETGEGAIGNGALFRTALANGGWDIILIHQVSSYANDYDAWQGTGNGGYLREFIRIIRQSNPNAAIGFLLVHSYATGYSGNTEGSALARWQNIALSAKKLVANYGVDFVIPYGTAVQNLRASTINTDKNDFSNDGVHLADGIGDYVAACCYFQMVYAPRFGKCIIGNTFRKTDLDETSTGVLNIDNTNAPLAQKAAMAAAYDWYSINNPDDL